MADTQRYANCTSLFIRLRLVDGHGVLHLGHVSRWPELMPLCRADDPITLFAEYSDEPDPPHVRTCDNCALYSITAGLRGYL